MVERHYILATAGHVDHGKSSLVRALTGVDPDRLPEEKLRGITIDLGFAQLRLPSGDGALEFSVGIVDVPGHEDFVKNMVAGVGSIDLALLVVAADDGWMPQTEEHLQILSYLGVKTGVVALTKSDLAGTQLPTLKSSIRERLAGSSLAEAPIVLTSVVRDQGLDELKAVLTKALIALPPSRDIGKPRLPVDRAFSMPGIGTVITGTLTGGSLVRGQSVVVQPGGFVTRVRSLQRHNREVDQGVPGTRTAVNLPDVAVLDRDRGHAGPAIHRGDVVTIAEVGQPADTLDVQLEKSLRLKEMSLPSARPLKDGALVRIHHGSGHCSARVLFLSGGELAPGETRLAELRCESPIFAFAGDRFIIRDWSEQWTLGGGVVLEPVALRARFRQDTQRGFLEQRARNPGGIEAYILTQVERDLAVRGSRLLRQSVFGERDMAPVLDELQSRQRIARSGEWIMHAPWWNEVKARATRTIQESHLAHPERPGMDLNELRRLLQPHLPGEEIFSVLLSELGREGFEQAAATIKHLEHRPALPPALQSAGTKLRSALHAKPFEPPSRKDLLELPQGPQALRFLLETGEAVDLGGEIIMATEHFHQAIQRIRQHLATHDGATAGELRQLLQTNRRVIIPLLERLDKEGVTIRQGDRRVLRPKS